MEDKIKYVDNKDIGSRIRIEREGLRLTRESFAEIVDFSPLYIGQLERGERQMSLSALIKISCALHVTTDYLIYGNTSESKGKDLASEESSCYYPKDNDMTQNEQDERTKSKNDLYNLLDRCTKKELALIENMVKLVLPYIK